MIRVLKPLLSLAIIITMILAIIGIALPKSFSVTKSIEIDSFQKRIFPYIADLNQWPKWSPWYAEDPTMQMHITGEAETIGHSVNWSSQTLGDGTQELTSIESPEHVAYQLRFGDSGQYGGATARFDLRVDEKVTVTWHFKSDDTANLVARYMNTFIMEKDVNEKMAQGLNKLKAVAEEGL